ncbi:SDR family oxidoreductase [uncultured Odoribacter sp.]|uniref:SDR family oxidoreductase n=1 Tax=uncultured Odoribacter sp. TaxID=876416 RepID=UPI00260D1184|nr:SDR family oxidoreductase [uncultured Odoribacter sp.]
MEKKNTKEKLKNPLTSYYTGGYKEQPQPSPGIQQKLQPQPDCGEESYEGHQRLAGRKALITGADSGIGRATAIAYAREGADIVLNYLPEEQCDAEEVACYIEKAGRKAFLLPGNLEDEHFCSKLVQEANQKLGGLDILTLVAGYQKSVDDIEKIRTEDITKTFTTNVFSLFWLIKAALPYLPAGSSIITTSSIQAFQPNPDLLDYAATKAAIIAFTRGLAKQLAPKGIRANCVAPGPIWTPLQVTEAQPKGKLAHFGQTTPLQRAGQPVELAGTYVLLASDESSYTTAEVYGVTGGHHTS